jgi:uncharacterized membrane protein
MTHSIKTRARAILAILLQYPIRQLLMTVLALLLASALGVALFCARALVTQRLDYIFLVWNLILAWSPLFFSGAAALVYLWRGHKSFAFIGCAILWLLFLPNAPYIVTDFVHLRPRPPVPLWLDIFLIMSFAGTGLLLGFVSLNIMHRIAAHAYGWRTGWAFTAGALALCGFGLYLAACRTYVHVLNSKPEDSFYGVLILGGIDWTLQNRSFNVDGILSPTDC